MASFVRSACQLSTTGRRYVPKLLRRQETFIAEIRLASGSAKSRSKGFGFKIGVGLSAVAASAAVTFTSLNYFFQRENKLLAASRESESESVSAPTYRVQGPGDNDGLRLTIYQYQTCPFCRKVRAYLDFYGLTYDVVEVNPVLRKEVKFSTYRKVPIVMAGNERSVKQFNDSSVIISALHAYRLGENKNLDDIVSFFPEIISKNEKGKEKTEYGNRYEIMLGKPQPSNDRKEEKKWRRWVDAVFVHTLSPNVYRTPAEALQAFDYISETGNFNSFEKYTAKYVGAAGMYFVSKYLKNKWHLKDDVRESLYDGAEKWMRGVGTKRDFMGGDEPNLADLAMYGVISAIEGFDAFNDMMKNTSIEPWYRKMSNSVKSHAGAR
ncbi:prostaglandin E synthase 2-like [Ptychodera flava]|uniref:prostaglandin E synthase 2-like n=1 Tax=Ptychodera flava TaxID=63121 RepID=UPI00396A538D